MTSTAHKHRSMRASFEIAVIVLLLLSAGVAFGQVPLQADPEPTEFRHPTAEELQSAQRQELKVQPTVLSQWLHLVCDGEPFAYWYTVVLLPDAFSFEGNHGDLLNELESGKLEVLTQYTSLRIVCDEDQVPARFSRWLEQDTMDPRTRGADDIVLAVFCVVPIDREQEQLHVVYQRCIPPNYKTVSFIPEEICNSIRSWQNRVGGAP